MPGTNRSWRGGVSDKRSVRTEPGQFNVEEDGEIAMEVETVNPNTSHTTKGASDMHKEHPEVAKIMESPDFRDPMTDHHRWMLVAGAALGLETEYLEKDLEDRLGHLEIAADVPIPALTLPGGHPVHVHVRVKEDYDGYSGATCVILGCKEAEVPPSVHVAEALVGTPEAAGSVLITRVFNESDKVVLLKEGQTIAALVPSAGMALRANDPNLKQTQQLWSLVRESSQDLLSAVEREQGLAAAELDQHRHGMVQKIQEELSHGELATSEIANLLQDAEAADIVQLLEEDRLTAAQVLQFIVPLVTYGGAHIGSLADGARRAHHGRSKLTDGRRIVHFVALEKGDTERRVHRVNSGVTVLDCSECSSVAEATDQVMEHVPDELRHAVWVHSSQGMVHEYGNHIDLAATVTMHTFIAALAASISPVAIYTIDTDPVLREMLTLEHCSHEVIDLAEVTGMPQRRRRLIISNIDLHLRKCSKEAGLVGPRAVCDALSKCDESLLIFDQRGRSFSVKGPAPPVPRSGLKIGQCLRKAKPLPNKALAKLQCMGHMSFDLQLREGETLRLIADAAPPPLGILLAIGVMCNTSVASTAATLLCRQAVVDANLEEKIKVAVSSFDQTAALLHLTELAKRSDSLHEKVHHEEETGSSSNGNSMQVASAETDPVVETDRVPPDLGKNIYFGGRLFTLDPSEEGEGASVQHAAATSGATGRTPDQARLQEYKTPQELQEQVQQALAEQRSYVPDLSDAYQPSVRDLHDSLKSTGIYERGNIPGGRKSLKFLEDLLAATYPIADHIFRKAGPHLMSIRVNKIVSQRPFPIKDPAKLAVMKEIIDDLLAAKVIEPSFDSPFRAAALLVPKKHRPGCAEKDKWRLVIDYRALNAATAKESYQPPPCDSIFSAIASAKIVSMLDAKRAFWQLAICEKDGSRDTTTFVVPGVGAFRWNSVPMGLVNSSSLYQRFAEHITGSLLLTHACCYVDDCTIHSKTVEDHYSHLTYIFLRNLACGTTLSIEKSKFFVDHPIELLGYLYSSEGLAPCPRLWQGIQAMAVPQTLKDLRAALGMFGFHRRFFKNFAEKSWSLKEAAKQGDAFRGLTEEEVKDFNSMKEELREFVENDRRIYWPDFTKPIYLMTDASRKALGAFAYQEDENGNIKPILYASRSVKSAEAAYADLVMEGSGYETRQIELLGVIYGLDSLASLVGSCNDVVLSCDHKNVLFMLKAARDGQAHGSNDRLLRWSLKLQQYDRVQFLYRPGLVNPVADALSRLHRDAEEQPHDALVAALQQLCATEPAAQPSSITWVIDEDHLQQSQFVNNDLHHHGCVTIRMGELTPSPAELKAATKTENHICGRGPEAEEPATVVYAASAGEEEEHSGELDRELRRAIPEDLPIFSNPLPTVGEVREAQRMDSKVSGICKALLAEQEAESNLREAPSGRSAKMARRKKTSTDGYKLDSNGLVCRVAGRYEQTVVPHDVPIIPKGEEARPLRTKIMAACHASMHAPHQGRHATTARVKRRFYWDGCDEEIRLFVKSCLTCRLSRSPTTNRFGLLENYKLGHPMSCVALDIVEFKGASSRGAAGQRMILIIVDVFSRFLIAAPLRRRTMKAVAAILIFKLFLPWGAPLRLIADQAFNNEEFQQLLEILKIKIRYTSPYNSRSNRSERYCGEVVRMIRTFLVDFGRNVNDKKFFGEAYDYLDFVVAAHNAKPMCHEGISPFEFQHGRPYHWGSDIAFLEDPGFLPEGFSMKQLLQDRKQYFKEATEFVQHLLEEEQGRNKAYHDRLQQTMKLQPGDQVVVHTPNRQGKFGCQFVGPAEVVAKEAGSELLYRIKYLDTNRTNVVHVRRLIRHHDSPGTPTSILSKRQDKETANAKSAERQTMTSEEDMDLDTIDNVQANDVVVLRGIESDRFYVARVVEIHEETGELTIHYFCHQMTKQDKRFIYDDRLALDQRKLAPEYSYNTRSGEERRVGSWKPKHNYEPFTDTVKLGQGRFEFELMARAVEVTKNGHIASKYLQRLRQRAPSAFDQEASTT